MNELFFGKKKKKKLHKRKKPVKCNSRVTLPRLRKLAKQNGINIYSEAKTGFYKTSGNPKPAKKVGCSTLKKRFNDKNLGNLYKVQYPQDNIMQTIKIQEEISEEIPEPFEVFSNAFGAKKKRRSPTLGTNKCNKNFTLTKLRKLAELNGISIYSNARTGYYKTTGMPKKPKKVGCSTLKKRLNDAGLGYLYKVRSTNVQSNINFADLFMETPVSPPVSVTEEILSQDPLLPSYDVAVKLPKPKPGTSVVKGVPISEAAARAANIPIVDVMEVKSQKFKYGRKK